jgi:type II secretory pathway pseudopilin PulG
MKQVFALVLIAIAAGLAFWLWRAYQRFAERSRAADQRFASAMTQAMTAAQQSAPDVASISQQKLLYEAAAKAGEAGEAVLSIQLYARLLARYPASTLGTQARAAVEAQKKKLTKP